MIIIERKSGYADSLRNYKVILDDELIGEIADGETKAFDIKPGTHTLQLSIDWAKSNELSFKFTGSNIKFKCSNALRGPRVFLAIIYATFLSHKYLKLERIV